MSNLKKGNIEELYNEIEKNILTEEEIKDLIITVNSIKRVSKQEAVIILNKIEQQKGRISKRVYKDLLKEIKNKTEEEQEIKEPGPRATQKDIYNIQRKISYFFKSPFAKEFPQSEKISFFLGGSLVSGFSQNKNSPYFSQPSDYNRISDVDLNIFISTNLFNLIFQDKRLVEKHLGYRRTLPIGKEEKTTMMYAGPFKPLIEDISSLMIAGLQRRVNFTFFEHSLLDLIEIHKEHLLKIIDITTF